MAKNISKLGFFKLAKEHFSKKENKVGRVPFGGWNKALCLFLSHNASKLSADNYEIIYSKIHDAVEDSVDKAQKKDKSYLDNYSTAFFPTDAARMKFINSQISLLTKKK